MLIKKNVNLILLPLILLLSCSAGFCQLNKSQWLAGVGTGYFYNKQTGGVYALEITNSAQVLPAIGYFIADKFCVGLRGGVSFLSDKQYAYNSSAGSSGPYYELQKSNLVSAGFFARYYFLQKTSKINVLADAAWLYNNSANTNSAGVNAGGINSVPAGYFYNNSNTTHYGSWSFAGGVAWFVSPKASLELTAGITTQQNSGGAIQSTSTAGLNWMLSFYLHLGKGKAAKK